VQEHALEHEIEHEIDVVLAEPTPSVLDIHVSESVPWAAPVVDETGEPVSPPAPAVAVENAAPPRRRRRRSSWPAAALVALGVAAVAFVELRTGTIFGTRPAAAPEACQVELRLHGLPPTHEVLLSLGRAPLVTRPLPTGVRLELVALAPDGAVERLVVPADAAWAAAPDGTRMLTLEAAPRPAASWPAAPEGAVGGVGPAGRVQIQTSALGAEMWLVVGAGRGESAALSLPCDEPARLLVVDPTRPADRRHTSLDPGLLRAAASQGGADVPLSR
jgi:hypothetical protein